MNIPGTLFRLCLMGLTSWTLFAAEPVKHWDFEGKTESAALGHWHVARARGACSGKWDAEHASSGQHSLRLSIPHDVTARAHWVAPRITVKPDTAYQVDFWIKTLNVAGEAYVILYENGKQTPKSWHVSARFTGTRDWQPARVTFRTHPDTTFLTLVCKLRHGTGYAWFDNITVREIPLSDLPEDTSNQRHPPPDDGFPIQALWTPAQWTQNNTLYLVRGYLNPLSLFFRGRKEEIRQPALIIEVPEGFNLRGPLVRGRGPRVPDGVGETTTSRHDGMTWQVTRLPLATSLLFAGAFRQRFHWENYFHVCVDVPATPPAGSPSLRWRFENDGKPGPWHALPIVTQPPPSSPPPSADFRLFIQHTGPLRHPNESVRERLVAYLALAGIGGGLAPSYYDPALVDADRQLAALGFASHTWRFEGWDYSHPGNFAAVDIDGKTLPRKICPLAQQKRAQPWFGDLQAAYRERLKSGLRRLIIDYEPASWFTMCYCPRCRQAFAEHYHLPLQECLTLPGRELRRRWAKQWAEFQARQHAAIVSLHSAVIQQAAPGTQLGLCSWEGTAAAVDHGQDIRLFEPSIAFHAPMIYTKGPAYHDRVAETCTRTDRPVLPFVELFDLSQPRSLTPAELRMNLLATGFAGGGGAFLWVGMECLDAEYLAAAAGAVRDIVLARKRVAPQTGTGDWAAIEPVAKTRQTVLVDGHPIAVQDTTGGIRFHQWGNAERCVVAILNYRENDVVRLHLGAADGTPCRVEHLTGGADLTVDPDGRGACATIHRSDGATFYLERK